MRHSFNTLGYVTALAAALLALMSPPAAAATFSHTAPVRSLAGPANPQLSDQGSGSLEAAASRAGDMGRKVAMSLIGLGFAIASILLVFRRDFKEAVGVFVIGVLAVVLATPVGVHVLRDTVTSVFGG